MGLTPDSEPGAVKASSAGAGAMNRPGFPGAVQCGLRACCREADRDSNREVYLSERVRLPRVEVLKDRPVRGAVTVSLSRPGATRPPPATASVSLAPTRCRGPRLPRPPSPLPRSPQASDGIQASRPARAGRPSGTRPPAHRPGAGRTPKCVGPGKASAAASRSKTTIPTCSRWRSSMSTSYSSSPMSRLMPTPILRRPTGACTRLPVASS